MTGGKPENQERRGFSALARVLTGFAPILFFWFDPRPRYKDFKGFDGLGELASQKAAFDVLTRRTPGAMESGLDSQRTRK